MFFSPNISSKTANAINKSFREFVEGSCAVILQNIVVFSQTFLAQACKAPYSEYNFKWI